MMDATIQTTNLSNNNDIDDNRSHGNEFQPRKHKYHHLLCKFSYNDYHRDRSQIIFYQFNTFDFEE